MELMNLRPGVHEKYLQVSNLSCANCAIREIFSQRYGIMIRYLWLRIYKQHNIFHLRSPWIFRGGLFLTKKCYPQKIGALHICKPPSLMCSIPQFENPFAAFSWLQSWVRRMSVLTSQKTFLCSDDPKVLSAKIPSGNILHTDGVMISGKEAAAWN